jgi:hypothetical protein
MDIMQPHGCSLVHPVLAIEWFLRELVLARATDRSGVVSLGPSRDASTGTVHAKRQDHGVGYGDHVMTDAVQVDEDLRRMLDARAITRVLTRYIRGVDRCDVESIKAAFHPDAVTHHGNFGDGGPDEFADFVVNTAMPRYNSTMHYISNIQFDFESSDVAYVETYLQAIHMRTAEINTALR